MAARIPKVVHLPAAQRKKFRLHSICLVGEEAYAIPPDVREPGQNYPNLEALLRAHGAGMGNFAEWEASPEANPFPTSPERTSVFN